MFKFLKSHKLFIGIIAVIILGISFFVNFYTPKYKIGSTPLIGGADNFQWFNVKQFSGFQTRFDPSKIEDGAAANGQNTSANNGDRISIRPFGYDIFPASSTQSSTNPIGSLHNFRKRSGESILIRSSGRLLEYLESKSGVWETISTTYSSSNFGFADYNVNTDNVSYVYFGNAVDNFSRWNGAHTTITSTVTSGDANIDTADTNGFYTSGTLFYCGNSVSYSSKTATRFVLNGTAPVNCSNGRSVTQAVEEFPTLPKGNIYLAADNRLFISGSSTQPQAVFFSAMASSTDFTTSTITNQPGTATASGIFNLVEGGGGVTALSLDETSIYIFKRTIIYKVPISGTFYALQPLKTFDGKSQTTGAVSQKSVFAGGNGIFFITPDNQIMYLTRVDQIDYPQMQSISSIIQGTTDGLDFSSSTGIVFRDKAYFSVKSTVGNRQNDTVLVYNIVNQIWDTPIVGWNASDFSIYDSGDGEQLYFGDGSGDNIYKLNTQIQDYIYGVTANWRSKQYDFGLPTGQKYLDNVYVEGYISQNTTLNISLLLDDNGFTQTFSTSLLGASSTFIYSSNPFNVFGLSPFGFQRFGSNTDLSGKKKFRIYLGKDFRMVPFYNAQIDFSSDDFNQQWEITDFGFHYAILPNPEKRELFHSFR